jgi:CBS domain containing-hemolysin-like protein
MISSSSAAGLTADDELIMVGGVMTFTDRPAREVMTPRTELVAVSEDDPLEDISAVFAQSGYSRLPVYRGTLDEIVGMLHAFDLFKLRPGDRLPIRPVANAPAGRTCGDLLLDMQRERRHLAVVLDEFGGTLGIVTLEDLLEELVGEIFDETEAAELAASGPSLFEMDGATPIMVIEEHFEVALPSAKTSTAGGLLVELAGRIPQASASWSAGWSSMCCRPVRPGSNGSSSVAAPPRRSSWRLPPPREAPGEPHDDDRPRHARAHQARQPPRIPGPCRKGGTR